MMGYSYYLLKENGELFDLGKSGGGLHWAFSGSGVAAPLPPRAELFVMISATLADHWEGEDPAALPGYASDLTARIGMWAGADPVRLVGEDTVLDNRIYAWDEPVPGIVYWRETGSVYRDPA